MKRPQPWCFLSFATDTEFRGGAVVQGHDLPSAQRRARKLNIKPGGECHCTPIEPKDEHRVPLDMRERLLSEREIRERLEGKGETEH
ncbi:MAG: hypothetical protein ABSB23_20520 [Bryobacteraceae bacterium]|jgi:hypothetical protein